MMRHGTLKEQAILRLRHGMIGHRIRFFDETWAMKDVPRVGIITGAASHDAAIFHIHVFPNPEIDVNIPVVINRHNVLVLGPDAAVPPGVSRYGRIFAGSECEEQWDEMIEALGRDVAEFEEPDEDEDEEDEEETEDDEELEEEEFDDEEEEIEEEEEEEPEPPVRKTVKRTTKKAAKKTAKPVETPAPARKVARAKTAKGKPKPATAKKVSKKSASKKQPAAVTAEDVLDMPEGSSDLAGIIRANGQILDEIRVLQQNGFAGGASEDGSNIVWYWAADPEVGEAMRISARGKHFALLCRDAEGDMNVVAYLADQSPKGLIECIQQAKRIAKLIADVNEDWAEQYLGIHGVIEQFGAGQLAA